jgi:hypothetical protein
LTTTSEEYEALVTFLSRKIAGIFSEAGQRSMMPPWELHVTATLIDANGDRMELNIVPEPHRVQ